MAVWLVVDLNAARLDRINAHSARAGDMLLDLIGSFSSLIHFCFSKSPNCIQSLLQAFKVLQKLGERTQARASSSKTGKQSSSIAGVEDESLHYFMHALT